MIESRHDADMLVMIGVIAPFGDRRNGANRRGIKMGYLMDCHSGRHAEKIDN